MVTPTPTNLRIISQTGRKIVDARFFSREGVLWLLAAFGFLVVGVVKSINLVILLSYVMLGIWLLNLVQAGRSLHGIRAIRRAIPPLFAGEVGEWEILLTRQGTTRGDFLVVESYGGVSSAWWISGLSPGMNYTLAVRARFSRRGRYLIVPMLAMDGSPFGLVRRSNVVAEGDEIIVFPRPATVDLDRLRGLLRWTWARTDDERHQVRRMMETGLEIHGLREYRTGDGYRKIDWKATARTNKLIVREFEESTPSRILLIIEPYLQLPAEQPALEQLESLFSVAAGLTYEWRRPVGGALSLIIAGEKPVTIDGPPGPGMIPHMLRAMALEKGGPAGDITSALMELSRGALKSPVLVLTTHPQSPTAAAAQALLGRTVTVLTIDAQSDWFELSKE
ncbi:MAG: DUF58 domain-containing protein [Zavarzinella sp.]